MREEHQRGLERAYEAAPITRWMGTSVTVGDGRATVVIPLREEFQPGREGSEIENPEVEDPVQTLINDLAFTIRYESIYGETKSLERRADCLEP